MRIAPLLTFLSLVTFGFALTIPEIHDGSSREHLAIAARAKKTPQFVGEYYETKTRDIRTGLHPLPEGTPLEVWVDITMKGKNWPEDAWKALKRNREIGSGLEIGRQDSNGRVVSGTKASDWEVRFGFHVLDFKVESSLQKIETALKSMNQQYKLQIPEKDFALTKVAPPSY